MNLYYAQISIETGKKRGIYFGYYIYARSLENATYHAKTIMKSLGYPKEIMELSRIEEVTPYEGMVIRT